MFWCHISSYASRICSRVCPNISVAAVSLRQQIADETRSGIDNQRWYGEALQMNQTSGCPSLQVRLTSLPLPGRDVIHGLPATPKRPLSIREDLMHLEIRLEHRLSLRSLLLHLG